MRPRRLRQDIRLNRHGCAPRAPAVVLARIALAPEYAERYTRAILDPFDLGAIVAELPSDSATALLCVERDSEACHRSLTASRLRAEHGLPVTDLRPG